MERKEEVIQKRKIQKREEIMKMEERRKINTWEEREKE